MPLPEGCGNCIPFFWSQDSIRNIHNVIYHLLHLWSSLVRLTLHLCISFNVDLFISLWLMYTAWIINSDYLILILSFSLVSLLSLVIMATCIITISLSSICFFISLFISTYVIPGTVHDAGSGHLIIT